MNREQFHAMLKDMKKDPTKLQEYRKAFKNVYTFSDGIFKILMGNEACPKTQEYSTKRPPSSIFSAPRRSANPC